MPNFVVYLYPTYVKIREQRNNEKRETGEAIKGSGSADPINALNKSDSAAGMSDSGLPTLEEKQLQYVENQIPENEVEKQSHEEEGVYDDSAHAHAPIETSVKQSQDVGLEEEKEVPTPNNLSNARHGFIRDFLGHSEREVR